MPRAKEFDPKTVLEAAMELFWEQGFEATSAQDLVDRTGLNRSSLYNTFGSKQELYLRALDHYRKKDAGRFDDCLEQFDSAVDAIRSLLNEAVPCGTEHCGCFVASATVERAHCDADTRERVCESVDRMREGFAALVAYGQSQGEIRPDAEPDAMAHFLTNAYFGMQTMATLQLPRSAFEDIIASTLRALK